MKNLKEDYSVVLDQNVNWGDMDAFGHVNNTVYFRYFEDARIAYLDQIAMQEHKERLNVGPILATAQCNFRRPLNYPDRIHIGIRASILSPRKFNMEFAVFSEQHGAVVADGDGLVVYYDYSQGKSCEIPAAVVDAIHALETQK